MYFIGFLTLERAKNNTFKFVHLAANTGSMIRLEDKVVWVTGATSGIGKALVMQLSKQHTKLIISARREEELLLLKNSLGRDSEDVLVAPLDLENEASILDAFQLASKQFSRIDILFNNGGISQRGFALDTPIEVDRKIMQIDFLGQVYLTKLVLPGMVKNGFGAIGVTSSLTGKFSTPYRTAYAAAKHALHGFFDGLRAEMVGKGVQVTIFCPGFIKTDISMNALTESGEKLKKMDDAQANGMSAEECARQMISALRKGKREVYIGGKETLGIYIKRFFPGLMAKIITTAKVR